MTRLLDPKTLALGALLCLTPVAPGLAEVPTLLCVPRERALADLAARYGEQVVALGVTSQGALMELLVAPETRTWTLLVTRPFGVTCLLASGEAWRELPAAVAAEPST